MIEQDTIRLLRECDSGVKMGVSAIDEVMDYTHSDNLKKRLCRCKKDHLDLKKQIGEELNRFGDEGKEPSAMSKGMSWLYTNMKLTVNDSDSAVAELILDGCNMGVKELARNLNQFEAADENSKNICKKLMSIEERTAEDLRSFL